VAILVAPIVPAAAAIEAPLLDVGSGNGSPGLVLALLRPDVPTTLLEPRQRRWAFLREAARAAGRPDVAVLRARHQDYVGPSARTVTVRALRLAPSDLERLVAVDGRLLAWGVPPPVPEGFVPETGVAGAHAWRRVSRQT
jgi:16S rRNA (guanine527-N7)-methyltransferase